MKFYLMTLSVLFMFSLHAIECVATKRVKSSSGVQVINKILEKTFDSQGVSKYEVDIEEGYFTLNVYEEPLLDYGTYAVPNILKNMDEDVVANYIGLDPVRSLNAVISIGPDYLFGTLFKGRFDRNGEMKLTFTTPQLSYILACQK